MSLLTKNVKANSISQLYVSIVGILIVPYYILLLGQEVYGLIGFFSLMQACFFILDVGLSSTISRETTRFRSGSLALASYRRIYKILQFIFLGLSLVGSLIMLSLTDTIVSQWLDINSLDETTVVYCIQMMSFCIVFRWLGGFYRGVVVGWEKFVWLSWFTAILSTIKHVGVLLTMHLFGYTPVIFFMHQLIVSLIELLLISYKAFSAHPKKSGTEEVKTWSLYEVKHILNFSLTIGFSTLLWVLITQLDKFVLSGILSLGDYGVFTLAVLAANGIMIITIPISSVLMPRLAYLYSERKMMELKKVYRNYTQLVTVVVGASSITLAVAAESFLFAWTGDISLARRAAPILCLYSIGNGFLAISGFAYYLQYARGELRYHIIGSIGFFILLAPVVLYLSIYLGGFGASLAWLVMNILYFFVWVAVIHKSIERGFHLEWLVNDILKILVPSSSLGLAIFFLYESNLGRIESFVFVVIVAISILFTCLLFSKPSRKFILNRD